MRPYDFEQSLIYWVMTTSHALERALNEELAPYGITHRQWQVLGCLMFQGGMTQTQLAERLRIEAPTLAGVLDRMERDGWIQRQSCPNDRRKKLLSVTPKVEPIWETITTAARRVRAATSQGLSDERVQQLIADLAAVRQRATEIAPEPDPDAAAPCPATAPEADDSTMCS